MSPTSAIHDEPTYLSDRKISTTLARKMCENLFLHLQPGRHLLPLHISTDMFPKHEKDGESSDIFSGWIHSYGVFQMLAIHSCQLKVSSKIIFWSLIWSPKLKQAEVQVSSFKLESLRLFGPLDLGPKVPFFVPPRDVHADQCLAKHAKVIWSATVASETKSGWFEWTQSFGSGNTNFDAKRKAPGMNLN